MSRRAKWNALALMLLVAMPAWSRVVRLEIVRRESPAYGGRAFGTVGSYEKLYGRVTGELDPADPHNTIIEDVGLAPRNARNRITYTATFVLIKPTDMTKASGTMIYDVPNRGSRLLLGSLQGGDPGDGFLFERGHVILSSGWQGDVVPREGMQTVEVPVAKNPDGSSITGPAFARFVDLPDGTASASLYGTVPRRPYATADLDPHHAVLIKKTADDGAAIPVPPSDWAFADCSATPFPGVPDPAKLCVKGGFVPSLLYELSYTAKDPLVLGIGLAAVRDINAFIHHETQDAAGGANPLAGQIRWVVAQGISQSGNFIRTFLHLGFNQDENGRIVWNGANVHIAARQVPLNFRFAVPGGAAALSEAGSEPFLWWSQYEDTARGRPRGSVLDRCRASKSCPKIFETFGSTEFWGLRMSPDLVGTMADRDIPLPPEVRRYYFPGTNHGGGNGNFTRAPSMTPKCALPSNPNPETESMRALLVALIDWVTKGAEPPPSRYPQLSTGDLVAPDHRAMGYPVIPGYPLPDGLINPLYVYDFGPGFKYSDMSGAITRQPPVITRVLPSLVPRVDADGNELGGVPSAMRQVPLGTYTGWNIASTGFYKGHSCGFTGGFIPFAATKAERLASGDPRLSIEERYPDLAAYSKQVEAAVAALVKERFLLPEDAANVVRRAAATDAFRKP